MPRCGISRVDNTHSDRVVFTSLEIKISNRETLTRTHADMNFPVSLLSFDADRSAEGGELRATGSNRMTEHKFMCTLTCKIQINIKTYSVGSNIIDSGIKHSGTELVDLNIPCSEMMLSRACQRNMQ